MESLSFSEFEEKLKSLGDDQENFNPVFGEQSEEDKKDFAKHIGGLFAGKTEQKCVLGIDILGYSKFATEKQRIIPILADLILNYAWEYAKYEKWIFQEPTPAGYFREDLKNAFIDTGDGGFFILPTPIHALVFALFIATVTKEFNTYKFYPKLRDYLGPVTLRYAMTYNELYLIDNRYFGMGIISNARIMSRDKLDRFLIDEKSHDWFLRHCSGIETLSMKSLSDLKSIPAFASGNRGDEISKFFPEPRDANDPNRSWVLRAIDVALLDKISAKGDEFSTYNLRINITARISDSTEEKLNKFVVTIGNLNPLGLGAKD